MKIIAILPVRNEAWIIRHTLSILEKVCDVILIADGDSTDGTREICSSFEKVQLIPDEEKGPLTNTNRRKILLDRVREYEGYNFILAVDADELLIGTVLTQEWDHVLDSMKPGDARHIRWYWIWKSPFHYREDNSVWSNRWMYCLFRDDRQTSYALGNWHEARIPQTYVDRSIETPNLGLMHYAQVGKNRMHSREAHCRVIELCNKHRSPAAINKRYVITLDEREIGLKQVPETWIAPWQNLGLDFEIFPDPELNYFDAEVLQHFQHYGVSRFADLDIWDINWEFKRQLALSDGIDGLPVEVVRDPRNWEQRLYHAYLHRHIRNPLWREPHRPLIEGFKRIGFNRGHLERLGMLKAPEL